jgi:CHAD domain-containing protein
MASSETPTVTSRAPEAAPAGDPVVVVERERKFEVPDGFVLPDLHDLPGVAGVGEPHVHVLEATYYDTADLRLARRKLTLRRRTGGTDDGWHLKTPRADGARAEHREPPGDEHEVPASLRGLVQVHVRGAELQPVVRLTTRRTVTELLGSAGEVLAELAQDEVTSTATSPDGHTDSDAWRELEAELVAGEAPLLDGVEERLLAAGARPSASRSKLAQALGRRLEAASPDGQGAPAEPAPDAASAAAVLLAHLTEQVGRLVKNDPLVRADRPDAVHQMRVACRRMRSALATYRPLLDRTVTDPIRDELRWLGAVLGEARDVEVVRDHLRAEIDREPADLVLGPVQRRLVETMSTRYRSAHDAALAELDGARYFALLDRLDALVAAPPLTDEASADARAVLPPLVAKAYRRVRRAVRDADRATSPQAREHALHEVRKAAKRARYAGESVSPVFGADAERFAEAMEQIQEVLGVQQDSVVAREELRLLAVQASGEGENGFTFGRLHALEQVRGEAAVRAFDEAWTAARRKRLRHWLR